MGVSNVTFEPGCRNHWHVHHAGGQILLVTGGRGYYQEWGRPARELEPGDVVSIPPETKHWHGAAPDSWFSHVAIAVPAEGASNEWLEPVSDEDYAALAEAMGVDAGHIRSGGGRGEAGAFPAGPGKGALKEQSFRAPFSMQSGAGNPRQRRFT